MIEFDPQINAEQTQILLVGCGGTGSAVATLLGRILFEMKSQNIGLPKRIAFIDPDIVSPSNIGRQNFLMHHVDMLKCEVLARQLSYAYGLQIEAYAETFNEDHLDSSGHYVNFTIIIGAVDNHHARLAIHNTIDHGKIIWIDSGNSKTTGQVLIGNTNNLDHLQARYRQLTSKPEMKQTVILPAPGLLLPELLEAEKNLATSQADLSCADLVALNEQDLLINQQMALITSRYLYFLLKRQPIRSNMTFIGPLSAHSVAITRSSFEHGWKLQAEASSN